MRLLLAATSALALAACGLSGTDGNEGDDQATVDVDREATSLADSMASRDPASGEAAQQDIPDPEPRPVMQAQVVLDRIGFGPGVIDGKMGMSTENALKAFQESRNMEVTGDLDDPTKAALDQWRNIPATRVVTIPREWGQIKYQEVPDDPAEQAKMEQLGYESLDEKVAERFHTTVEVLRQLNPGGKPAGMQQASFDTSPSPTASARPSATSTSTPTPAPAPAPTGSASAASQPAQGVFSAGQQIRVPNIGADQIEPGAIQDRGWQQTLAALGVGTKQPKAARVVVDKSDKSLKAYDAQDKLVAAFMVTTGSSNDPLPLGEWGITGVGRNPPFAFNPELFWDVPDSEAKQQLPPGPNGPVGVVWIDLTKEHYGIHGTSAPETIGRAESHGCVRLTNWDAARLAGMVSTDTKVIFQA